MIALLLTSPEFEVLGLVMDHGNTWGRARVAGRLLYELGLEKEIPIVVGRPTPGIVGQQTGIAGESHQFIWGHGFDRWKPASTNAADFIIHNLRKYPNEVILFTVGPVSNIEDVMKQDPEALKLAKRVISMFGSFTMGYGGPGTKPEPEWNVRADVQAAKALLASGATLELAGLDTTTMVKLGETDRMRLLYRNFLGRERKLYYREMVERFSHHPAISWNLGEENVRSVAQQRASMAWLRHLLPYRQHIVIHNGHWHAKNLRETFDPLLGGTLPDADDPDHDDPRRFGLSGLACSPSRRMERVGPFIRAAWTEGNEIGNGTD